MGFGVSEMSAQILASPLPGSACSFSGPVYSALGIDVQGLSGGLNQG